MQSSAWKFESESSSSIVFSRHCSIGSSDSEGSLVFKKSKGQLICEMRGEQVQVEIIDNLMDLGDDIVGVTKAKKSWMANRLRNKEISIKQHEQLTGVVNEFVEIIKKEQWENALAKLKELENFMKHLEYYIDSCKIEFNFGCVLESK